jgi:Raf kinase inhibitor-like YbhB/YbcL family protein
MADNDRHLMVNVLRVPHTIVVESPAFQSGGQIPDRHSAYHDGVSPALSWQGIPRDAEALAILVEDPDAPRPLPFAHWLVANLPPTVNRLPNGIPNEAMPQQLQGAIQGVGDKEILGYFGPRPPEGHGTHHYHFQVIALSSKLDLPDRFLREDLISELHTHALAIGDLVGTYERSEPR